MQILSDKGYFYLETATLQRKYGMKIKIKKSQYSNTTILF